MSQPAIRVENLGKRFRLGQRAPYYRFSQLVTDMAAYYWRRLRPRPSGPSGERGPTHIWALKDVNFEVPKGEVLGIIGSNGAGKTTLLKILSKITEPTEGQVEIRGRVGSLLEVGTGFHPELTGRENVYLNGAILGLTRGELKRKFDEIVAFAEVEKFLDTPVKHYSSGMQVRLGFAVAVHVEPEILIVDEVLSVGDAAFQSKCLRKINEVAQRGRTVIVVSHSMPVVQRLCQRVILIDNGQIASQGEVHQVVEDYYKLSFVPSLSGNIKREVPPGSIGFVDWSIKENRTGNPHSCFSRDACTLNFRLVSNRRIEQGNFGLALWASDGTLVWAMRSLDNGGPHLPVEPGEYDISFSVDSLVLRPGTYQIQVSANDHNRGTLDSWHAQPQLTVLRWKETGLPVQWQGILNLPGSFECVRVNVDSFAPETP